ncbi:MAG: LysR family transcriptional regulator [Cohaesibacter sp.]|jgi:DNA-binding transcriptional LysR family regulator|nr:LysR family transcriptional regulator [Cohaesibacter sp.]
MKFRQLEAFRHIMISGSMVGAATQMHITQSAVSRLISDLEYGLNFKLFERKKGLLVPTPAGLQFYDSVEENFLGLERLENIAEDIRKNDATRLRITATHSIATIILPKVLEEFAKKFPHTRIALHSHRMSQIVMRMQNSSSDIAIGSEMPKLPNMERIYLGSARQVCILPQNHPLAEKEVIEASDLYNQSIIGIMIDGPVKWTALYDMLAEQKIPIRKHYEINNSHTAYSIIAQGLAIGVVEPLAHELWHPRCVVKRPFEPAITMNYYCALQTRQGHRPDLEHFANLVKQQFAKTEGFEQ